MLTHGIGNGIHPRIYTGRGSRIADRRLEICTMTLCKPLTLVALAVETLFKSRPRSRVGQARRYVVRPYCSRYSRGYPPTWRRHWQHWRGRRLRLPRRSQCSHVRLRRWRRRRPYWHAYRQRSRRHGGMVFDKALRRFGGLDRDADRLRRDAANQIGEGGKETVC